MAHKTKEAGSRRTHREKRPDDTTFYELLTGEVAFYHGKMQVRARELQALTHEIWL
jgi:hypothetical protein